MLMLCAMSVTYLLWMVHMLCMDVEIGELVVDVTFFVFFIPRFRQLAGSDGL